MKGGRDRAMAPDRLAEAVEHRARALAELPPAGLRAQNRFFRAGEAPHLDASMQQSIEAFGSAYESGEPERLMRAFLSR